MNTKTKFTRLHFGVFDLFKIGIGPSSSHTVGPMLAASRFINEASFNGIASNIKVIFYGSLAFTGKGHASDTAVILGLSGYKPKTIDPDIIPNHVNKVNSEKSLKTPLGNVSFDPKTDIIFNKQDRMPHHSNAMKFQAYDKKGELIAEQVYYSIGGGFVLSELETHRNSPPEQNCTPPLPFDSGDELLALCQKNKMSIAEIMMQNEMATRSKAEVLQGIDDIWSAMKSCIDRGLESDGLLPGPMQVSRRAKSIFLDMQKRQLTSADPLSVLDYVNVWAMAVNEENAAGGRVVTAPTNGAAGIIPAVARYFDKHIRDKNDRTSLDNFFLTAAAIGSLYKKNASISGAEAGCQGEVGVACSMAAAGLAAAKGGTPEQIEEAAEIGMEHNLGLTCDPVGGLVQIPCIERNAMGAAKAINAARIALRGDGKHYVTLDNVIETMRQTGLDMREKYKETSEGGLAVNVPEC